MNCRQALSQARQALAGAGIEDTLLECELLLRHARGIDRVRLYQDLGEELPPEAEAEFWRLVERRLEGEPVAYILGHREFYTLDFHVDPRVLIPRPESELLVEKAIELAHRCPVATIADIGTGCGNIAICLALHLPPVQIYAVDSVAGALEMAQDNSRRHGTADRITFLQGELLEPLPEPVNIIVANLPYVRAGDIDWATCREPREALDGGADGLDQIRRLCRQLPGRLTPGGHLLLEIGYGQREAVLGLLTGSFPGAEVEVAPDLGGIDRVVSLRLVPAAVRGSS